MHYNFIEIGTSNFNTCCQQSDDHAVGISIEPISYYLNQLPDRPFIKKINCAVSRNNVHEDLEVFYVPEQVLAEHNLPSWLRGCNAVGNYHKQHEWLNITHLVKKELIKAIPIKQLFIDNDVTSCDLLKIDTEGSDSDILLHLVDFLRDNNKTLYPKKIIFESNVLTPEDKVFTAVLSAISIGYKTAGFTYPSDESTLVLC